MFLGDKHQIRLNKHNIHYVTLIHFRYTNLTILLKTTAKKLLLVVIFKCNYSEKMFMPP